MTKKARKVLSIVGIIIAGFAMVAVFNHANAISTQSLTGIETDSRENMIYLFANMAITFAVGGISLKTLLDDMQT